MTRENVQTCLKLTKVTKIALSGGQNGKVALKSAKSDMPLYGNFVKCKQQVEECHIISNKFHLSLCNLPNLTKS